VSLNGRRLGSDGDKRGYTALESEAMAGRIHDSGTATPSEVRGEGLYTPNAKVCLSLKGIEQR
jgi:hypothetical protein